jgi:hypothetical protein
VKREKVKREKMKREKVKGERDDIVDGWRLLRRFERGREPHVRVVHSKIIDDYEHLDVIWAMDSVEKVGREVRDVYTYCGRHVMCAIQ